MQKALPRVYTDDFKLEAIKLSEQVGPSEARRRLNLPESTLANWLTAHRKSTLLSREAKPKPTPGSVAELQAELNRLRRENSSLKLDVEILKKATAYFAKGSK